MSTQWLQQEITVNALPRGCHLITDHILRAFPDIEQFGMGLLQVFLRHTSASLSLNENADPDVRVDLESSLNAIVPEDFPYTHTIEGPDDMPAHVKSSLLGASLLIPIQQGRLALGTWQGIYLWEHRDHGTPRRLMLTAWGIVF